MKKTLTLVLAGLLSAAASTAQSDTTQVTSLEDIIQMESGLMKKKSETSHYQSVWKRNTFLNLSKNSTTFSSSELPTVNGQYSAEYENKLGLGLQWGHTYNFHKNPIGSVLFIGLDYTWMDINANRYDEEKPSAAWQTGDAAPFNAPWHNEKWTFDYGMSLGPALTLYPFTAIGKKGTDNIRLQLYYHVGYCAGLAILDKAEVPSGQKTEEKTPLAWSHGLYTSFGASLTWNFVGIGYEWRKGSDYTFQHLGSDFKTGNFKATQDTNRLYLQFRF